MTQRRTDELGLSQTENNSVDGAEVQPPPPCSTPSFLLTLPSSPWHNCCIAADVISCFLLGLSAVGPHLTFGPLLSDCTFSFQ